jgi:hypothetical protein
MAERRSKADKRLDEALKRFKVADEADSDQRERELSALKFDAGDQWPDWVKRTRSGSQPGSDANIGARPMLTIPLLDQPIAQVINQQKSADLGLNIRPKGDASIEDAEVRQGIIRDIQVQSRAKMARNWAYERAVKVGRGYYEIRKVYTNDRAHPFDQELRVERILNQGNVLFDPFCQQADCSDAEYAFKWTDVPEDVFKREFPKAKLSRANESELEACAEETPGWIGGTEASRTFRVAEYWYASYEKRRVTLYTLPDGSEVPVWDDEEAPDGAVMALDEDEQPVSRVVPERRISWCKITANEILEETTWEGQHIPIIPVIGKEFNINGERQWKGIVEPAMDSCRLVNFTASAIAEGVALAPKAPFVLDPEQIEGYESWWKSANTRNSPFLPRKAFDDRGNPYPPIERQTAEPPVQAMTMLLQQGIGFVQNSSATPASALGQLDPTHRSGKAVKALQERSELANSNYLDNLATISMTLEGIILNEMIPYVYDRPGRVVQMMAKDGKAESVMVNASFVKTKDGPQPAPEFPSPDQKILNFELKPDGTFGVVVEVGKSYPTRREEGAAAMGEIIPHLQPEMSAVLMPDYIEQLDFPGAQKMAATLRKALPPHLQEQEEGGPNPEVMQLQQQVQQLQQALEGKFAEEQAKQQATAQREIAKAELEGQIAMQKAEIENMTKIRLAEMNNATAIRVAEINAASKGYVAEAAHAAQHEQQALNLSAQEAARAEAAQEAENQRAHERQMADQEQANALETGAVQHAQTLEQQANQPEAGA